jgi:hypothetical protein
MSCLYAVIPAKAGIHVAVTKGKWIPAFAGMTQFGGFLEILICDSSGMGHYAC